MLLGCCGAVLGLPALAAAGAILPPKYQIPFSGKSYRQFVNGSDDLFVSTEHKYTHGPSLWGAVGGPIALEEPTAESVLCAVARAISLSIHSSGIGTFGHLPYADCWNQPDLEADLLIMGAPYDIGTSYRPGARFGPAGIRTGSKRVFLYGVRLPLIQPYLTQPGLQVRQLLRDQTERSACRSRSTRFVTGWSVSSACSASR